MNSRHIFRIVSYLAQAQTIIPVILFAGLLGLDPRGRQLRHQPFTSKRTRPVTFLSIIRVCSSSIWEHDWTNRIGQHLREDESRCTTQL